MRPLKVFVTVGTQLPFDRLLQAVDNWAAVYPEAVVKAQTGPSTAILQHIHAVPFLPKTDMDAAFAEADVIVGHAGMGTILTGAELGKPVIAMPRSAAMGEHRNDHQTATAKRLSHLPMLHVAKDADAVARLLNGFMTQAVTPRSTPRLSRDASPTLLAAVARFVQTGQLGEAV